MPRVQSGDPCSSVESILILNVEHYLSPPPRGEQIRWQHVKIQISLMWDYFSISCSKNLHFIDFFGFIVVNVFPSLLFALHRDA